MTVLSWIQVYLFRPTQHPPSTCIWYALTHLSEYMGTDHICSMTYQTLACSIPVTPENVTVSIYLPNDHFTTFNPTRSSTVPGRRGSQLSNVAHTDVPSAFVRPSTAFSSIHTTHDARRFRPCTSFSSIHVVRPRRRSSTTRSTTTR